MKGDGFGIVSVFVISHCFLYSAASYFAEQKLLFFFYTLKEQLDVVGHESLRFVL